jgi:uncharacterized protein (TIGR02594 family)
MAARKKIMTDTAPPWLATMREITGTKALGDNPVILSWPNKIGELFPETASYCREYTHDSIAWCGLTVGYCMALNGIRPVFGATDTDRFLWAAAWLEFGTPVDTPQLGDIVVFQFSGGGHHVTLYEQTTGDSYVCRGGNQGHQVRVSNFASGACMGIRRPPSAAAIVKPAAPTLGVQHFSGITATVFGGSSDRETSAYDGHVIGNSELGVALPARFPAGARPKVRVWNDGRSVICDIIDVGPWNTNDPYWKTGGRPQAESGVDSRGRRTNHAGIDLTPAAARGIGIDGKGTVDWEFADAVVTSSNGSTPVKPPPTDTGGTAAVETSTPSTTSPQTGPSTAGQEFPAAWLNQILAAIDNGFRNLKIGQATTSGPTQGTVVVQQGTTPTQQGPAPAQQGTTVQQGWPPPIDFTALNQFLKGLRQFNATMLGQRAVQTTDGIAATPAQPILSPIDKVLGGEALVGLKTPIAIIAYAALWIMQSLNTVGPTTGPDASTTAQVLTALIAALGGLGVTAKVDRGVQSLNTLATTAQQLSPPTSSTPSAG